MSMSQEEIEALMNGLDIDESESDNSEEASDDSSSTVNQEELYELVSSSNNEYNSAKEENEPQDTQKHQQEEEPLKEAQSNEEEKQEEPPETKEEEKESSNSNEVDNEEEYSSNEVSSKDVDENDDMSDDEIDNMLSQIDGVSDDDSSPEENSSDENKNKEKSSKEEPKKEEPKKEEPKKEEPKKEEPKKQKPRLSDDDIVSNWTNTKINEGAIPLPADKDTKVVSQLNQVANDSEEKVSRIFDVLSLGLDNNNDFRTKITDIEKFVLSQEKLLNSLSTKFPNIDIFKNNIAEAKKVNEGLESLKDSINDEDMKIFEAMELMQFNDINRQKIERVMSVIRKLSLYLNNLFEDDYTDQEIAVAKHIPGDEAEDLIGEDLDKLIEEFGKNNN